MRRTDRRGFRRETRGVWQAEGQGWGDLSPAWRGWRLRGSPQAGLQGQGAWQGGAGQGFRGPQSIEEGVDMSVGSGPASAVCQRPRGDGTADPEQTVRGTER